MSSRDEKWWQTQAGELVLGTLNESERELFSSIRDKDPEFERRAAQWEQKLSPLDETLAPVEPSKSVWESIEAQIGINESSDDYSNDHIESSANCLYEQPIIDHSNIHTINNPREHDLTQHTEPNESILDKTILLENVQDSFRLVDIKSESAVTTTESTADESIEVDSTAGQPKRHVNLWRDLALLTSIACLVLGFSMWNTHYMTDQPSVADPAVAKLETTGESNTHLGIVSIVSDNQSGPLWVINAKAGEEFLQVSAINPPAPDTGNFYRLWLQLPASEKISVLGRLPVNRGESVILDVTTPLQGKVLVSLESDTEALDAEAQKITPTDSLSTAPSEPSSGPSTDSVHFESEILQLGLATDSPSEL